MMYISALLRLQYDMIRTGEFVSVCEDVIDTNGEILRPTNSALAGAVMVEVFYQSMAFSLQCAGPAVRKLITF